MKVKNQVYDINWHHNWVQVREQTIEPVWGPAMDQIWVMGAMAGSQTVDRSCDQLRRYIGEEDSF